MGQVKPRNSISRRYLYRLKSNWN